jgi:sensor histidine kinase YesM
MRNSSKIWSWRTFGAVLCFYTVFSLFFVPRIFFVENWRDELAMIFYFALANYIWAGLTLLVFRLGEIFPVVFPFRLKNLGLHFLFSLVIVSGFTCFYVAVVNFQREGVIALMTGKFSPFFIINTATQGFMYYTGSLAAHQAVFYSNKLRERESQLQQSELQILKMQLHPHFFFNTLNAVSALTFRSPKKANRLIAQLGDLFRIALRKDKLQEIPLKDELEFLRSFFRIHQTLLGKRLRVEWQIEPETLDALVPNLILQPLAENAVQHGIAPLEEGGRITIGAARRNGKLLLEVIDDGQGLVATNESNRNGGIGLSNTRARLANLYDGAHEFSIEEPMEGGVAVKIEIPFREQITKEK